MKNKKYIWIGSFVLSILLLTYSYKDIKLYYYVKMGNKNYYSKNYEKAIEYYEKALKIKEDYNIRINLIITDYQMKNYKKVLESPVENGFLKGNLLVFMSEKNQNNTEDLKKSLEYYKEEILTNDDINIKKNYEIIENRLKEQQQNQDNKNNDNNQQENKDKKQNQNSDSEKDKNNNDNQQNNQSQDNKNQQNNDNNRGQDNKDNQNNDKQNQDQNKNNQSNQNSNDNQNDLNKNNNEQNNSQENLDNSDKEKSKNNDQEKNQNSNSENEKERENNKNSNSQNSSLDKPQQSKQQKELQLMLKNLEKNEKQSFKNNERLIGVENESDTKNKW